VQFCKHKKLENRFLTIGQVYLLSRNVQTRNIQDKDFLVNVITGNSIIDDGNREVLIYDPMETLEEDWMHLFPEPDIEQIRFSSTSKPAEKESSTKKEENPILLYRSNMKDLMERLKGESRIKEVQDLKKLLQSEQVDKGFIRNLLAKMERKEISHNYISLIEYGKMLESYINLESDFETKDIEIILTYLMLAYQPMDRLDFPHIDVNKGKINKLILKTKGLKDEHPNKWTKDRYDNIRKQVDPYKKLLYFDNRMFIWFTYIKNSNIENVGKESILTKYLLDIILVKIYQLYGTRFMVLPYKENEEFYNRFKKFFSIVFKIISSNPNIFNVGSKPNLDFFLPEQLDNQYRIKEKVSMKKDIESKLEKAIPKKREVFQYMLQKGFLEEFPVI